MDNLLTYCGLVAARISASDKDLPVPFYEKITLYTLFSWVCFDSNSILVTILLKCFTCLAGLLGARKLGIL